ncbi:MAG: GTPase Era [Chloroflexi bacterium HGW-Chloroflexi-8]|jgi:GTP-binding protein Era|nr:MAG: GTPase Era [Chloroflexi bacterium HGW-Chloroflexi-8]
MSEEIKNYRSGFVAVIGRPNVGKSTLLNKILKQKIAAVSPKPQTTRKQQLGILTTEEAQVVFIDTPGMHIPHHKLGEYMNQAAEMALEDADLLLWIVDSTYLPTQEDRLIAERIQQIRSKPAVFLVMNKIDLVETNLMPLREKSYRELLPEMTVFHISAEREYGISELMQAVLTILPEGQPFYDEDQITDLYERDIAIELIREAVLNHLADEVPHAVAVRLDEYKDRGDDKAYVMATLFVERESQKGILIGKQGSMIRDIGTTARQEIEALTGRQVFLDLRVKVHKNWRNNPEALNLMGYSTRDKQ